MAVCEMHLTASNALQKMTALNIIVPEKKQGPFPVLYLLHGLSDDHTAWVRRTSLERYVQNLPLIVVMPNGERGWYANSVSNPAAAYETFITQDLIEFIDGAFNTIPIREGRAIAGLSMGGYGAFKLALQHPDLFCAAVSFSGALDMHDWVFNGPDPKPEHVLTFGDRIGGTRQDVGWLAEHADKNNLPALWMCCGDKDGLFENNQSTHRIFESLGIEHFYREDPGFGHSWEYWDKTIQDALPFLKKHLRIED